MTTLSILALRIITLSIATLSMMPKLLQATTKHIGLYPE
jgi:hypothetical protein